MERQEERQHGTAGLGAVADFPGILRMRDGMLERFWPVRQWPVPAALYNEYLTCISN